MNFRVYMKGSNVVLGEFELYSLACVFVGALMIWNQDEYDIRRAEID